MKVNFREFCQILAALRLWQRKYGNVPPAIVRDEWDEHFEDVLPLSDTEIDNLCERINFEEHHDD